MGLLGKVNLNGDFALQAFTLVKGALATLPKPISVVELRLDQDDYEQLKAWLALDGRSSHIEHALTAGSRRIGPKSGHTDAEIVGLLLHALYAEHSRRVGAEWLYWPVIRRLDWPQGAEHWFSGNHPTLAHKHVLAMAAEQFGLRNAFDDGGAEWFMTGKLQFGFTRRGAEENLQDWLANPHSQTVAIRALLGNGNLGMESRSFKDLFDTLSRFRQDNLGEAQARAQLGISPWVLPESVEALLKAAKRSASHQGEDSGHLQQPEFLGPPALKISGKELSFNIEVVGLSSIGLEDEDHEIVDAEGRVVAHLKYAGDGGFHCLPPSLTLSWADGAEECTYTLRQSGSPATIATQTVHCWDPADWVQIFTVDGRRLKNERSMPPHVLQGGFDLVCPAQCKMVGASSSRRDIDANWTLYQGVQASAADDVKILHDGDIIWDSQSAKTQDNMLQQSNLQLEITPMARGGNHLGGACKIRASMHPLFKASRVQVGQHRLDSARCFQAGGESFPVEHDEWCTSLPVVLRVSVPTIGQSGVIRTRINLSPPTFIWMKEELPIGKPFNCLLTSGEPSQRLGVGSISRDGTTVAEARLFEGESYRGKCPAGAFRPSNLAGLGERLDIWPGVFNEPNVQWTVAGACVDQGIMKKCVYQADGAGTMTAEVKLSKSSAKSDSIDWVACLTGPKAEKVHVIARDDRDIVLSLPPGTTKDNLLSIISLYDGRRVGSWFNKMDGASPHLVLDAARDKLVPDDIAPVYGALMRAGKLPLLDANTTYHLRAWINQRPIQAFLSLLRPVTKADVVGFCEAAEGGVMREWNRSVGRVFESSPNNGCRKLTLDDAMDILRFFNSENPVGPLLSRSADGLVAIIEITRQMAYVSPVLARDVLRLVSSEIDSGLTPATWLGMIKQSLHCSDKDIDDLVRPLGGRVDYTFFHTTLSLKPGADPVALRNLGILLQLPAPSHRARHAARDQRTAYLLSQ